MKDYTKTNIVNWKLKKKLQNIGKLQSNFSSEYSQKNKIKKLRVDKKTFLKEIPKKRLFG